MEQYPLDLYVLTATEPGVDDDGFVIPGETVFNYHSECRESSSWKPSIVSTTGGERTEYSTVIVMPLESPEVPVNTKIQVRDGEKVVIEANVIRFVRKQLHCRLWV